jgi:hypothetical protein
LEIKTKLVAHIVIGILVNTVLAKACPFDLSHTQILSKGLFVTGVHAYAMS